MLDTAFLAWIKNPDVCSKSFTLQESLKVFQLSYDVVKDVKGCSSFLSRLEDSFLSALAFGGLGRSLGPNDAVVQGPSLC